MIAQIQEPEYITIYHAVDWLSGIVGQPSSIFTHEKILMEQDALLPASSSIIKLNEKIFAGILKVYSKSFPAIFHQMSTSSPNQPGKSLDYPDYLIDWDNAELLALPHYDVNECDSLADDKEFYTPASFNVIEACREIKRELGWWLFSFEHLNDEYKNFFVFEKHGLRYWHGKDEGEFPKDAVVELLFFKVSELRDAFSPEDFKAKGNGRGRPQKDFAEWSLLVFLHNSVHERNEEEQKRINAYLEKISFVDLKSTYDVATPKDRRMLIDSLYKDTETLSAILTDLNDFGININNIVSCSNADFQYFVTREQQHSAQRTLQKHFTQIKQCAQNLNLFS